MPIVADSAYTIPGGKAVSDQTINAHCWALQQLLCAHPPEQLEVRISAPHTRVAWQRGKQSIEVKVQVLITDVFIKGSWTAANFEDAVHQATVRSCDIGSWLSAQDGLTRKRMRSGAALIQAPPVRPPQMLIKVLPLPTLAAGTSAAYYCAALERFARKDPPMVLNATVSPFHIFVKLRPNAESFELHVNVTALNVAPDGAPPLWQVADLSLHNHRSVVDGLDWSHWISRQHGLAQQWVYGAAARRTATTTSALPNDSTTTSTPPAR